MNSRKSSPALAAFGCPELCHIIARHLNQTDLYRCLLVDKTLFKSLFPYLWRSISFSDFEPYYWEFLHLDRQQQLQQVGQFGGDYSTENQTSTPAPKRSRQERPYINDSEISNPWTETSPKQVHTSDIFLPLSPSYSSLTLHGHLIDTLTLEWDEGLDFLPDPEMATCLEPEEESGKMQTWIYIRLLQQCPNIRVLKIRGRNPELPYRRPKWDWCGTGREDEFLGKHARTEAKDLALAKVIYAAGLLSNSHLDKTSSSDGEGGPGVSVEEEEQRAHAKAKKLKATKATGIQEFYISNSCGFSSESFKALIQAFSPPSQLRVLDISACEHIRSSSIQILLKQFPGLQKVDFRCRGHLTSLFADSGLEFEVVPVKPGQFKEVEEEDEDGLVYKPSLMSSGSGSGNREPGGRVWACEESLRVLRTGIKSAVMEDRRPLRPPFSTINTGTSTVPAKKQMKEGPFDVYTGLEYPACFYWFYDHLAKLTNLRELCLVSVWEPMPYALEMTTEVRFTLEEGLDRLTGLKQLEVLDVEHLHHQIGVAELQWMVANWPRLRVIRGLIFEEDAHTAVVAKGEDGTGVEMAVEESDGWSEGAIWLKMARPDIEVPVLERRWKGS
ncbi:hypothetical protein BGZ96_010170 [Linnemannia gamsii]|uniref:F-box domain-containing protein n=1 Tax=Linnemannia gamsii TaxID=64522 RepID=A0ABQ7JV11_9FUNG|nr:hypothetical protein BGZ96_010170 [Linnemannia gamsii]